MLISSIAESSEESGGGGAEQRRKQFQPAPIYDALEIDWESLVKKTPHAGHTSQGDPTDQSGPGQEHNETAFRSTGT